METGQTQLKNRRGRGRPRKTVKADGVNQAVLLSREVVIATTLELTRTTRLEDISFLVLADHLSATPGSIHYHVGSREALISETLNRVYREIYEAVTKAARGKDWITTLSDSLKSGRKTLLRYPGVTSYIASNSRFRLFQPTELSGTDFGSEYLNAMALVLRDAGLKPEDAAMVIHVLHTHVIMHSVGQLEGLMPEQSSESVLNLLEKEQGSDNPREGLLYLLQNLASVDTDTAYDLASAALLDRIAKLPTSD